MRHSGTDGVRSRPLADTSTGSPRLARSPRRPPAVTVRRTSFTVAPYVCATSLNQIEAGPNEREIAVRADEAVEAGCGERPLCE
jgi:hypothetical protein